MLRLTLTLAALAAFLFPTMAAAQGAYGPGACEAETTRVCAATGGPAGPVNLEEIDGNPVDVGAGLTGLGTLRFRLATDESLLIDTALIASWQLGAGIVTATTQRMTIATDDVVSQAAVRLAFATAADGDPVAALFVTMGGTDGIASRALRLDAAGAATVSALQLPPALGSQAQADSLSVVPSAASTWTVDTELPAAAALSDATANPTAPAVGSFLHGWDNSAGSWDRLRTTSARLAIDFDLIGGSQVSTGAANVGTSVQTVYLASNPTPACADVDVSDAADTATLAAAAGRLHAMIQVEYGETDGPVQCGMGAASANGMDLEPAADATSTGGSWAIEGYSGAITCRSASGTVTVHACGW